MIPRLQAFLAYRSRLFYVFFRSFEIRKNFGFVKIRLGKSDLRVFDQIFLEENYHFFPEGFQPKVIIDAGANVGYSAIWFSSRFKNSTIIALEPESENFKVLKENCRNFPNIIPIKKALWSHSDSIWIKNSKVRSWSFETVEIKESNSISIESTDMISLIEGYQIDGIGLLKIDIEGAEKEIFESNIEGWISKVSCIMIETHDRKVPGVSRLVDEKLLPLGFIKFKTKDLSIFFRRSLF